MEKEQKKKKIVLSGRKIVIMIRIVAHLTTLFSIRGDLYKNTGFPIIKRIFNPVNRPGAAGDSLVCIRSGVGVGRRQIAVLKFCWKVSIILLFCQKGGPCCKESRPHIRSR